MEFIAPFQEQLRATYPSMEEQRAVVFTLGPEGMTPTQGDRQWKLTTDEGDWVTVLGPSFVSIETTNYESRTDFVARLTEIVGALRTIIGEIDVERLGVRYTDRLVGEFATTRLPDLVRPEVLGLAAATLDSAAVQAAVTQTEFKLSDGTGMTTRWGLLPPGATLTPDIQPVDEVSWVLDLDAAVSGLRLSEDLVKERSQQLCTHAYDFFRWVVTEEFVRAHGGTIE